MGTLCNLNLVIFKCFYYQSEKIVAGDINSLNLLVFLGGGGVLPRSHPGFGTANSISSRQRDNRVMVHGHV